MPTGLLMSADYTQQQTPTDQERSKDLSLQRTRPPTEVKGYEAQRFLGAGAYGEVWVGIDKNTGRQVAIKFYAHRRGVDWSLLSREVEKLVFLSADRYVVQLLEVGWDSDPPYYVMEYVENGSLEDLLHEHGTLSVPEAVEMFREIAIGLAHAHGKGVLHCDLKPANILLDQDHRPRLADFGQSRLSHEQKPALGTLFYMAPEQADLSAVPDVRWDVYALGAIFNCLLTGRPPHKSEGTIGQMETARDLSDRLARYRQLITSSPLPTDYRRLRGMDRALADIIDRCLAPEPVDRFANVQEVLEALESRDRNRSRLPLMVLGFLGPLLLLLVTGLFSWRGYQQAVANTEAHYLRLALENNSFTAQLAAERVRSEIRSTFDVAREEAARLEEEPSFAAALASDNLRQLNSAATPEDQISRIRTDFRDERARRELNDYVDKRLATFHAALLRDRTAPKFASVFVVDRQGTQIAAAHEDDLESKGLGRNFAHRSYFHGGERQLEPFARPPEFPPHIDRQNLSAVYKSTSSQTWKVAISTPLWRFDKQAGERIFAGLLVVTVNLGDFESFQPGNAFHDRFAVLVDGRPGDTGAILQHPLLDDPMPPAERKKLLDELPNFRVPPEIFTSGGGLYEDPLGKQQSGGAYSQQWVAAISPVRSLNSNSSKKDSGLIVLVQSSYENVVQPARILGDYFLRNFVWMLVVVVVVSGGLWYLVLRMFRKPRLRPRRRQQPTREPTPLQRGDELAATVPIKK